VPRISFSKPARLFRNYNDGGSGGNTVAVCVRVVEWWSGGEHALAVLANEILVTDLVQASAGCWSRR
jgi:hypothetical protein